MRSDLALRFWRLNQEMGEPLPTFSEDDVVNFMVTEAVMLRGFQAKKEDAAAQKRAEWKRAPVGSGMPTR